MPLLITQDHSGLRTRPRIRAGQAVALIFVIVWFAVAFMSGLLGLTRDIPSAVLLISGFLIPAATFFAGYSAFGWFRQFVLDQNLRDVTRLQASRITGIVFLLAYYSGNLPALFAIPTAASDMTVGITAPIVAYLWLSAEGAPKRPFVFWHGFGILGLIVSGSLGILTSPTPVGILAGDVTSQAMSEFPLVLVPTFLGPLVLILHLIALTIVYESQRRPEVTHCETVTK